MNQLYLIGVGLILLFLVQYNSFIYVRKLGKFYALQSALDKKPSKESESFLLALMDELETVGLYFYTFTYSLIHRQPYVSQNCNYLQMMKLVILLQMRWLQMLTLKTLL